MITHAQITRLPGSTHPPPTLPKSEIQTCVYGNQEPFVNTRHNHHSNAYSFLKRQNQNNWFQKCLFFPTLFLTSIQTHIFYFLSHQRALSTSRPFQSRRPRSKFQTFDVTVLLCAGRYDKKWNLSTWKQRYHRPLRGRGVTKVTTTGPRLDSPPFVVSGFQTLCHSFNTGPWPVSICRGTRRQTEADWWEAILVS